MANERLAQARQTISSIFPERHVYIRSGGVMKKVVLTPGRQTALAAGACGVALWSLLATGGVAFNAAQLSAKDAEIAREKANAERLLADRQARLNAAVAQLNATEGNVGQIAQSVESRHNALAMVLAELTDGSPSAGTLAAGQVVDPLLRVQAVRS